MKEIKKISAKESECGYRIHTLDGFARRHVHDNYGLWIFSCRTHQSVRPEKTHGWRYFEFYAISHLIEGEGVFLTPDGKRVTIKTGQAVMVSPGFVHYYGSEKGNFTEDCIRFTGEVADQLHRSGIIINGVIEFGKLRKLLPIIELAADPSDNSQIKANIALQNLLVESYLERSEKQHQQYPGLKEVDAIIRRNPEKWWTIEEMASICQLSPNRFREVFRDKLGISPKKYLDNVKMQLAAEILCKSNRSIAETAAYVGYTDPYHFSRRFKEITGCSPKHYREGQREVTGGTLTSGLY